jgi:Domain of unknown function (DUF1707)
MSQQPSPPRGYSFAPLFRGLSAGQQMRVSDAEREAVTDRLAEHYAEGRLDHNEFDKRVGQAMGAKTRADLTGLFADLPAANREPRTLPTSQAMRPARSRRHGHPVALLVLAVVIFLAAAHALVAGPWLWLAFAAAAVLYMTRGVRRTGPSHQR